MNKNHNLFLSVPRSGYNLIRYSIEFLTNMRTPGSTKRIIKTGPLCYKHDHNIDTKMAPKTCFPLKPSIDHNLIFLYRDPNEILSRYIEVKPTYEQLIFGKIINGKVSDKNIEKLISYYIKLFNFYEHHQGNKLLVRYEDLLLSLKPIKQIIDLFNLPMINDFDVFLENESVHRKKAFAVSNLSISKGKIKKRDMITELDMKFKNKNEKIFNKYLNYFTDEKKV